MSHQGDQAQTSNRSVKKKNKDLPSIDKYNTPGIEKRDKLMTGPSGQLRNFR